MAPSTSTKHIMGETKWLINKQWPRKVAVVLDEHGNKIRKSNNDSRVKVEYLGQFAKEWGWALESQLSDECPTAESRRRRAPKRYDDSDPDLDAKQIRKKLHLASASVSKKVDAAKGERMRPEAILVQKTHPEMPRQGPTGECESSGPATSKGHQLVAPVFSDSEDNDAGRSSVSLPPQQKRTKKKKPAALIHRHSKPPPPLLPQPAQRQPQQPPTPMQQPLGVAAAIQLLQETIKAKFLECDNNISVAVEEVINNLTPEEKALLAEFDDDLRRCIIKWAYY